MDFLPLDLVNLLIGVLYGTCDISFFMLSMTSHRWYVHVLQFRRIHNIHHNNNVITPKKIISRGYLSILQRYLYKSQIFHIPNLFETAVEHGHLHIMKWAKQWGFYLDTTNPLFCSTALKRKEYDILQWALDHGCRWNGRYSSESPLDYAIRVADINLLQWALTTKWYTGHPKLCAAAAFYGQLECLKILRAFGCLWSSDTCSEAALNGHLEVLKWAKLNGCEWTALVCHYANNNGNPEMFLWA